MPISAFGQNVKRLRLAHVPPMKAKELAALIETDPSVVSRWEQGKGGLPEGPTLIKLGKKLGVSLDDLIAGVDAAYDSFLLGARETVSESQRENKPDDVTSSGRGPDVQKGHPRGGLSDVVVAAHDRLPEPTPPLDDAEVRASLATTQRYWRIYDQISDHAEAIARLHARLVASERPHKTRRKKTKRVPGHGVVRAAGAGAGRGGRR